MTDEEAHAAWLEARKYGIGGSDAACLLNVNPYKTKYQLWDEKSTKKNVEDISHKANVKYGIQAEEYLRALFLLDYPQYDLTYDKYEIIRNEKYPFIFATLDGKLVERDTGRKGILEIKTTNILNSMQKEKWNDQIPQNYFVQCLWQMLATGWDFVVLKAQLKQKWKDEIRLTTRHYYLAREDYLKDIEILRQEAIIFWDWVENKTPPPEQEG